MEKVKEIRQVISRIDHVSIAVRDYEKAFRFFSKLLGAVPGARAEDPSMKYTWQLFSLGDLSRIELMKATEQGSFLENFLRRKEGGVHHITLETPNIEKMRLWLEEANVPYFGYGSQGDRWKELFIHPRDAFGVLIQIAEFNPDEWLDDSMKMKGPRRFSVTRKGKDLILTMAHPGGGRVAVELTPSEAKELAAELEKIAEEPENNTVQQKGSHEDIH